ncbi:MAG: hypothetical protein RI929_123 [Actinomycetota bacterium]
MALACQEYNEPMGIRAGSHRDRHGRGLRRPLPSKLFHFGVARLGFFESVVQETCEYLQESYPKEFEALKWRIEDVPAIVDGEPVKRFSVNKTSMTITLYRIPIERFGRQRLPDPRMHIEHAVISAAASLIDKDPWELMHPH